MKTIEILSTDRTFNLSKDCLVWNGPASFIIIDNLGFLIDPCSKVLLAPAFAQTSLLDQLANVHGDLVMLQLISFSVQLGRVLGGLVLFV